MHLPTDPPTQTAPTENLIDTAPLIDHSQRETDFSRVWAWRGKELAISLASEMYYRELRTHMNAPRLDSYETRGDFAPEAARVIYCAGLNAAEIRHLRLQPPHQQIALHDAWVEKNIAIAELDAAAEIAEQMQQCINRARAHSATGESVDGSGN